MHSSDLDAFTALLRSRLSVYTTREPTEAAITAWGVALKPFAMGDIYRAFDDWMANGTRAPVPADIVRRCRDYAAERATMSEAAERQADTRAVETFARTPRGREALRALVAAFGTQQRGGGTGHGLRREWASEIVGRVTAGEYTLRDIDFATDPVYLSLDSDAQRAAYRDRMRLTPAAIALACEVTGDDLATVMRLHHDARAMLDMNEREGIER